MADDHHPRRNRSLRLSLPSRVASPTAAGSPKLHNSVYPYPPPPTPAPTPSKHRLSVLNPKPRTRKPFSLSNLFLLLFSLRSLYSLLPFIRSSPFSFSLFPFSFLVSLLSLLLTLSFSLITPSRSKQHQSLILSLTHSQHRAVVAKSLILAVVFLLRFQALRYCGTAAMILAELSGTLAARIVSEGRVELQDRVGRSKVRGFFALFAGLFLLSTSWDRIECFPFSAVNVAKSGISIIPRENCIRVWPMLLPFLSGFLGCYEQVSMNGGGIKELDRKQVRLISLFYTTIVLFMPAVFSMFVFEAEGDSISIRSLGWPLANTVVFGVLLNENYTDEKLVNLKGSEREFVVTFICTLLLELVYFPELSLWGLLICGLLIWSAIRGLDSMYSSYLELGVETSDSIAVSIMKPVRHILSERKSKKIALFLLINTGYMLVEFAVGFMSNSLGLISDACHMLFDCAALAIGLYASYISRLPANGQFNYGRGRFEVLSGYMNAVFLVLVGALIVVESFERILDPQEISTSSLMTVSIGGLLVNVVGLIFFHEEHHHAHGGGGSCSHSHAHAHAHAHAHDHKHHHDHKAYGDHHLHHDLKAHNNHRHHSHDYSNHDHQSHDAHHHHYSDNHNGHDHKAHNSHHHHHDNHLHDNWGHDHKAHGNHHQNHACDHHHSHDHGDNHYDHSNMEGHHHHHHRKEERREHHHRHIDHNMEGIFLHVLADTMGSVGVVISTLLIKYKGWLIADPACSIFISVLIVSSVIPLLRNSAEILLQRVPRAHEQELKEAFHNVTNVNGVCGIHNVHVWSFTNTDVVGTVHLRVSTATDEDRVRAEVSHILHDAGIKDLTLQVECVENNQGVRV